MQAAKNTGVDQSKSSPPFQAYGSSMKRARDRRDVNGFIPMADASWEHLGYLPGFSWIL